MSVRAGDARDWDFARDLGLRTIASSRSRGATDAALAAGYERLLDAVASQSHVLLVAQAADLPVGFLFLLDALPDEVGLQPQGFVAYMAVEPAFSRRGVGTALLSAAEDEARRRGIAYMSLMVTESNAPARRLYERAGYLTERRQLCKRL
ncbi:MAG TPA: GNAT family N-acetyltransferase [Candidatus Dormibacteraeota bacterium]|nr:GNAT family N-acetyltransferase [Candidatus Dormibacteraeota bacterium]